MRDPREAGPRPPFPPQEQPAPGEDRKMRPVPDHGERSYSGHGRLEDRVALVTGGDSGIGRAVAIAFAREGADVAFSHLAPELADAEETSRWVRDAGRLALPLVSDLSRLDECRRLVRETVEAFGRIDVLVNNAAVQGPSVESLRAIDPERIRHTLAVNVEALFHVTREALEHMSEGAVIINTTSIQAFEPSPEILDYAVTKAAIHAFTKGLSKELLARGIRVNAVAPGPVWTPLVVQSFDAEEVASFGRSNPMGRPAQPAELAPTYVFLACEEACFVTGEVIGVTGGKRLA